MSKAIEELDRAYDQAVAQKNWRRLYGWIVHPAADVFPMMSDKERDELGADIKANGLREDLSYYESCDGEKVLVDGRNRLVAMARVESFGKPSEFPATCVAREMSPGSFDRHFNVATFVISKNIRRRHLSAQEQLDFIVAARMADQKPGQRDQVSKGGRGKVDPLKAAVTSDAAAAGLNPSPSTVQRSIAKAKGKTPKPSRAKAFKSSAGNLDQLLSELNEAIDNVGKVPTEAGIAEEPAVAKANGKANGIAEPEAEAVDAGAKADLLETLWQALTAANQAENWPPLANRNSEKRRLKALEEIQHGINELIELLAPKQKEAEK